MAKGYPKPRDEDRAQQKGPVVASRYRWILPDDFEEELGSVSPDEQARIFLQAVTEALATTSRPPWPSASGPDFETLMAHLRRESTDDEVRVGLDRLAKKLQTS